MKATCRKSQFGATIVLASVTVGICVAHAAPSPHEESRRQEVRQISWPDQTLDLGVDGTYTFAKGYYSELEADGACRICVHIRSVEFGDVDADGAEDALLIVSFNLGGASTSTGGYVFGASNGHPILRATIEGGHRGDGGLESLTFKDGIVIVRRFSATVSDGVCCPSRVAVERWRWVDDRLTKSGPTRVVRRARLPLSVPAHNKKASPTATP